MPPKIRELKADLRKAGYIERQGKGSHTVWSHPLVPERITLSGADGADAKRYQEQDVRDAVARLQATLRSQP